MSQSNGHSKPQSAESNNDDYEYEYAYDYYYSDYEEDDNDAQKGDANSTLSKTKRIMMLKDPLGPPVLRNPAKQGKRVHFDDPQIRRALIECQRRAGYTDFTLPEAPLPVPVDTKETKPPSQSTEPAREVAPSVPSEKADEKEVKTITNQLGGTSGKEVEKEEWKAFMTPEPRRNSFSAAPPQKAEVKPYLERRNSYASKQIMIGVNHERVGENARKWEGEGIRLKPVAEVINALPPFKGSNRTFSDSSYDMEEEDEAESAEGENANETSAENTEAAKEQTTDDALQDKESTPDEASKSSDNEETNKLEAVQEQEANKTGSGEETNDKAEASEKPELDSTAAGEEAPKKKRSRDKTETEVTSTKQPEEINHEEEAPRRRKRGDREEAESIDNTASASGNEEAPRRRRKRSDREEAASIDNTADEAENEEEVPRRRRRKNAVEEEATTEPSEHRRKRTSEHEEQSNENLTQEGRKRKKRSEETVSTETEQSSEEPRRRRRREKHDVNAEEETEQLQEDEVFKRKKRSKKDGESKSEPGAEAENSGTEDDTASRRKNHRDETSENETNGGSSRRRKKAHNETDDATDKESSGSRRKKGTDFENEVHMIQEPSDGSRRRHRKTVDEQITTGSEKPAEDGKNDGDPRRKRRSVQEETDNSSAPLEEAPTQERTNDTEEIQTHEGRRKRKGDTKNTGNSQIEDDPRRKRRNAHSTKSDEYSGEGNQDKGEAPVQEPAENSSRRRRSRVEESKNEILETDESSKHTPDEPTDQASNMEVEKQSDPAPVAPHQPSSGSASVRRKRQTVQGTSENFQSGSDTDSETKKDNAPAEDNVRAIDEICKALEEEDTADQFSDKDATHAANSDAISANLDEEPASDESRYTEPVLLLNSNTADLIVSDHIGSGEGKFSEQVLTLGEEVLKLDDADSRSLHSTDVSEQGQPQEEVTNMGILQNNEKRTPQEEVRGPRSITFCNLTGLDERSESICSEKFHVINEDDTFLTTNKDFMDRVKTPREEHVQRAKIRKAKSANTTAMKARFRYGPHLTRPLQKSVRTSIAKKRVTWSKSVPLAPIDISESLKARALNMLPLRGVSMAAYQSLLMELEADKRNLEERGCWRQLPRYGMAIQYVVRCQMELEKKLLHKSLRQQYLEELESIIADIRAFDEDTKSIMEMIEQRHKQQRAMIMADHEKEYNDYVAKWSTQAKARQYTHASQELIEKRAQFEKLLESEHYEEAERVGAELEEITERETTRATENMKKDFKESVKKLKKKQQQELQLLEENIQAENQQILSKRSIDREILVNVQKKIEVKGASIGTPDKVWNTMRMARMDAIRTAKSPTRTPRSGRTPRERTDKQPISLKLPPIDFNCV